MRFVILLLALMLAGLGTGVMVTAPAFATPAYNWCPGGQCQTRAALERPLGAAAVHLIYFRSDQCGACVELEGRFLHQQPDVLSGWRNDPRVEMLVVDLHADPAEFDRTLYALIDRGLAPIYNGYLGLTGLIVVAQTGGTQPTACLNIRHTNDSMLAITQRIADAVSRGQPPAQGQDLMCPPFVNPLP